ncbi:MAG TPA: PAS domain S-box protein [Acidimicrobiales bacterium]|nr:PAS domain S-box protein [Acidimicrobiales bacterium]
MRTPSLRSRVVVLGVIVVVVVLASINGVLYLAFRTELLDNLDVVLQERAELAIAEGGSRSGPELATRLTQLGLRATVRTPDGAVYEAEPPSPRLGRNLADRNPTAITPAVSRDAPLPDGSVVTVYASRAGVDDAGRKLLLLDAAGLVMAALFAALLLHRTSRFALRPVQDIAASARRTAAGHHGERLRPDRRDTSLGQLAAAYDDMLDTHEAAVKRANDAQTESELLYLHLRQVMETAQAGFVGMDASGVITEWNRKAEELFGWTEKEAVGRALADTLVPPALRGAHTAGLRRFLDTGENRVLGKTVEFEALHRDGHFLPVEVSTWVTYIGDEMTFSALLHDISERRKGEEAIGRLGSIVESAQEAIFSTSLDGEILTWNLGAERMYGYTADEAIGQSVSLIVPPERTGEIANVRERVQGGEGVSRYETVRRRKDGGEVEVAVTSSPIFDGWGAVIGASTIARDITEQRRMQRVLQDTMAALEHALAEARLSDERSREFLADAAHQLRSPIAGVRACAETLLRSTVEGDRDALLADLVRESARAGRLINALLRLARVDQGAHSEPERCDLVALCTSEVERTRVLAPEVEVALHVGELPVEQPVLDSAGLVEILSNLLDNARRHAVGRIEVSVSVDDGDLHILVANDGVEIPAGAVEKIFHRFVSLDGKGGSGLGLPIARGIAQGRGGDLTYDTRGFLLTLPLRDGLDGEVRRHRSSSRVSGVQLGAETP